MAKYLPIGKNESVIVTAHTLPSLCDSGTFLLPHEAKALRDKLLPADGEIPVGAALFLERGRIAAIKLLPHAGTVEVPPGWRLLTVPPQQLLIPAFVDCHIHIALDGVEGFRTLTAPPSPGLLLTRLREMAAAGVLAARDGGDCYGSALTAQRLSAEAGPGNTAAGPLPRIVPTGLSLYRHGHYGVKLGGVGLHDLHTLQEELCRRKDAGAQQLKVILSGLVSLKEPGKVGPLQFTPAELRQIVNSAAALDLPVMVHASSDDAVSLAVQAGAHSVEHGYFVKEETIKAMAAKGIAWIPTVAPMAALTGWSREYGSANKLAKFARIGAHADTDAGAATDAAAGTDAETNAGADGEVAAARITRPGFGGSSAAGKGPAAPQNSATLRRIVDEHLRMIAKAHDWGVTIGVGTDGGAPGVTWSGGFWRELALLNAAGISPGDLLRLATVNGAAVLGLAGERGRIATGKTPYWLCLEKDFLRGRITRHTLKAIIYPA